MTEHGSSSTGARASVWAAWTARIVIAAVLIVSAGAKLLSEGPRPTTLDESIWSSYMNMVHVARAWIAVGELCLAFLLLMPAYVAVACTLLRVFVVAGLFDLAVRLLAFDTPPRCGCLGAVELDPHARAALSAALLLLSFSAREIASPRSADVQHAAMTDRDLQQLRGARTSRP
jgi:hypothetical protein